MNIRSVIIMLAWLPFALQAEVNGLGDIAKIVDRDDGLFDVTCKNGDLETGVSLKKLIAGDVCEKGKLYSQIRFDNLELHGICSMRSIRQTERLVNSSISFSSFNVSKSKQVDGCFPFLRYRVPNGYKVGFKTIDVKFSIDEDFALPAKLMMSGNVADGQPSLTKDVAETGKSTVRFDFPEPIFSGCDDGASFSEIQFSLILQAAGANANGSSGGKAKVTSVKFLDSFVEKCSE